MCVLYVLVCILSILQPHNSNHVHYQFTGAYGFLLSVLLWRCMACHTILTRGWPHEAGKPILSQQAVYYAFIKTSLTTFTLHSEGSSSMHEC